MADALKDIEAAILEVDVFQFERPDGVAVELARVRSEKSRL